MALTPEQRKKKMMRRDSSKVPPQKSLGQQIEEATEGEVVVAKKARGPKRGPLGNYDYVEHGSAEHAALLSLDPQTLEPTFDTSSLPEKQVKEFVDRRRRMLATPDYSHIDAPPAWNPDGTVELRDGATITEITGKVYGEM